MLLLISYISSIVEHDSTQSLQSVTTSCTITMEQQKKGKGQKGKHSVKWSSKPAVCSAHPCSLLQIALLPLHLLLFLLLVMQLLAQVIILNALGHRLCPHLARTHADTQKKHTVNLLSGLSVWLLALKNQQTCWSEQKPCHQTVVIHPVRHCISDIWHMTSQVDKPVMWAVSFLILTDKYSWFNSTEGLVGILKGVSTNDLSGSFRQTSRMLLRQV